MELVYDGDCYFLSGDIAGEDCVIRFSQAETEDYSYIEMYLFGEEKMLGIKHDYKTPKDLLSYILTKDLKGSDYYMVTSDSTLPPIEYLEASNTNKMVINNVSLIAEDRSELLLKVIPHLSNRSIMGLIQRYTEYEVISIYCIDGDSGILTTEPGKDTMQIGYAIVNTSEMYENTFYDKSFSAVSQMLDNLNDSDEMFAYSIYIADGNGSWELLEEGDPISEEELTLISLSDLAGAEWELATKIADIAASIKY